MTVNPSAEQILEFLKTNLGELILAHDITNERRLFITISADQLHDTIKTLINDGMRHLSTITGIHNDDQIELLYHFVHKKVAVTLRTSLPLSNPVTNSITSIIPGATLYEREVHEMLGVDFKNHPELIPLVLPENWPQKLYPLRKDVSVEDLQKQLSEDN